MSGYYGRSGYKRRSYRRPGRQAMANRRPGPCRVCGAEIPGGAGQLWFSSAGEWSVIHTAREWRGSPVSGRWVGGCPDGSPAPAGEAPRDRRGGYVDECGSCGMASCSC